MCVRVCVCVLIQVYTSGLLGERKWKVMWLVKQKSFVWCVLSGNTKWEDGYVEVCQKWPHEKMGM